MALIVNDPFVLSLLGRVGVLSRHPAITRSVQIQRREDSAVSVVQRTCIHPMETGTCGAPVSLAQNGWLCEEHDQQVFGPVLEIRRARAKSQIQAAAQHSAEPRA